MRPANAAQPWTGPPAAVPTAAAASVASSVWLRGRVRRPSIALGRAERAATAWSTSINVPATTAVTHRPAPERRHHGGGQQRMGERVGARDEVAPVHAGAGAPLTSSEAPIAPPRSPSAASSTAGGWSSANRCGIIASRIRST